MRFRVKLRALYRLRDRRGGSGHLDLTPVLRGRFESAVEMPLSPAHGNAPTEPDHHVGGTAVAASRMRAPLHLPGVVRERGLRQ